MRIALVSPYALDVVGGVQRHVLALADALVRMGEEVLVLGPSSDGAAGSRTEGGARVITVGSAALIPANGSRAPIALAPAAALRVQDVLRRAAPDVVHIHEPLVPLLGPAAVLAGRSVRVLTFHAHAEAGLLRRLYRSVRLPGRRIVEAADALIAVSPVAADFHSQMLGIDRRRIAIVPNGVDVARFARGEQGRRPDGTGSRLVFLGRLEPRKGADVAVRAFLLLAPQRPDLRLRVLGDGPLAPSLADLVASAPREVAGRVELFGRVESAVLAELLADADVALLPARGGESFGMVLLEAMAAGVPIVATDIPGYRSVARHDREALLVPPDDPRALAGAAARLLDDEALADRLRRAGRLRACEHDWASVAVQVREVYARAVRVQGAS